MQRHTHIAGTELSQRKSDVYIKLRRVLHVLSRGQLYLSDTRQVNKPSARRPQQAEIETAGGSFFSFCPRSWTFFCPVLASHVWYTAPKLQIVPSFQVYRSRPD
jgi:hypothetical protein